MKRIWTLVKVWQSVTESGAHDQAPLEHMPAPDFQCHGQGARLALHIGTGVHVAGRKEMEKMEQMKEEQERRKSKWEIKERRENVTSSDQGMNPKVAGEAFVPTGREDPAFPASLRSVT